jgi:hypothetical protein
VSNNSFPASPPAYFLSLRLCDTPPSAGLPASPAPQPHGCQGIYCSFFQSAKVLHTFYLHILYCFEPRVEVTCVRLTCGALRPMMPRAPMHGPRLQHTASRWCRARASEASDRHVGAYVHPFVLQHLLRPTRGPQDTLGSPGGGLNGLQQRHSGMTVLAYTWIHRRECCGTSHSPPGNRQRLQRRGATGERGAAPSHAGQSCRTAGGKHGNGL